MDLSRQKGWFEPEQWNKEVHIIGVGAVGSWVALQLAKMGVRNMTLHDFDKVEAHNLCNQVYGVNDIGKHKVDTLADIIENLTHYRPQTSKLRVKESSAYKYKGFVFVLTDTMKSRNEIFEGLKNGKAEYLIETRMGAECGRVYTVNLNDDYACNAYKSTLYTDEQAETSLCGTSLSLLPTALNIASLACWTVIKDYKGLDQDFELLMDYEYNNFLKS